MHLRYKYPKNKKAVKMNIFTMYSNKKQLFIKFTFKSKNSRSCQKYRKLKYWDKKKETRHKITSHYRKNNFLNYLFFYWILSKLQFPVND